ncbi:aldehyde dehydrogenase family protein [Mycoplasma miroungirhinis]|uniref:Aldehyde dehydrogenase n=1 Tax=Mycoplasma miroungirhinis TaxID=754516 RepID=A0A6M4JB99_9MOLU|nr:aldehyde dehydrogenase family protein [Mycoplasma miroungirhinis]QJR44264.1 aldehyde dehydrogenase family protein [Mycoplasma miroungirhinis]
MKDIYINQRNLLNQPIDIYKRKELLIKLKKLIKANEENIFKALLNDLNKHKNEAFVTEIALIYKEIDFAIKNIKKWTKWNKVKTPFYLFGSKSQTIFRPLGQVLIISPWNFPIYLTISPLISAIAAGNRIILKTSEISAYSSEFLINLINQNFDSNIIYCAPSDLETSKWLLDQKFDLIFFTGSTSVGKIVASKAAEKLTPTILELGGKCPTIIDKNTNLDYSFENIFLNKMINFGQVCIAPDFLLVHNDIKDLVIEKLTLLNKTLINKQEIASIINQNHKNRLNELSNNLLQEAQLVVFEASVDSKIMEEEIFGPFLPLITYKNDQELINFLTKIQKPLAYYVYSKDKKFIKNVFKYAQTGTFSINDSLSFISNYNLPFGGIGNSGHGKSRGYAGFKSFSYEQSYYKKWLLKNIKLQFAPHTENKLKWIKKLFK